MINELLKNVADTDLSQPSMAQAAMTEMNIGHIKSLVAFSSMSVCFFSHIHFKLTSSFRYQFGQALGGVVFPPYSECFGRKVVYIATTLIYCLACILIAQVPTMAGVCVGRFICGIMSAVPSVVVEGSIEDLFNMKSRVWIIFLWACATTAGLVLGPIYGAYISAYFGWYVFNSQKSRQAPYLQFPGNGFSTARLL
jgi:MFS family permease